MTIPDATVAGRWHLVFLLLSMERTAPFWREMGLPIDGPHPQAEVRAIARDFVSAYRRAENDAALTEDARFAAWRAALQSALDAIGTRLGDEAAAALMKFSESELDYESPQGARLFVWGQLLRRLAGTSGQGFPLIPSPLDPAKTEEVRAVVLSVLGDPRDQFRVLKNARESAPSPWERGVLATYTAGADPMDWVENQIEIQRAKAAWRSIAAVLDPAQRAALVDWARRQAAAMEMPADEIAEP